jgi:hypothetical protein
MANARVPSTRYSPTERAHARLGLLNATTEVFRIAYVFYGSGLSIKAM